jgi:predicted DNA-binding transcriptional regulator YafY
MLKDYLDRLQTIDHLIRIKGTGTPKQLAQRLCISERTLYEILALMKDKGAPIKYCKTRQSYYYQTDGEFAVKFFSKSVQYLTSKTFRE